LKGLLLADRGFHNKAVVERLNGIRVSAFGQTTPSCRLISPPHHTKKTKLSPKESKLYKRRWAIETAFQSLKYTYSDVKLNLRGSHSQSIKTAKFFAALVLYNLSR
jgi:IS4 transposase